MPEFIPNRKVLYIDDEEALCASFKSLMRQMKLEIYTLTDSSKTEELLKTEGPFAVVLSDQRMPVKDGVAVLQDVKNLSPETIRVLVTGYADMDAVKGAINIGGITNYVSKPWKDDEFRSLVDDLVARFNVASERRYLLGELKLKNETLQLILDGTVAGVVKLLSDVIGAVGEDVAAQNVRIRKLGQAIVNMIPDIDDQEKWAISRSIELFNLGLSLLPPMVQLRISKEGVGIVKEVAIAQNHHLLAANLLRGIPRFERVAEIIMLMRKNFDGTGEPYAVRRQGNDLPVGSRILKILLDLEDLSTSNFRGREVLESMLKKQNVYDTGLIQKLLGSEETRQPVRKDLKIPVYELKSGMILLEDLMTQNGQLLLRKNSTLTETTCKLLSQWGNIDPINSPVRVIVLQNG